MTTYGKWAGKKGKQFFCFIVTKKRSFFGMAFDRDQITMAIKTATHTSMMAMPAECEASDLGGIVIVG